MLKNIRVNMRIDKFHNVKTNCNLQVIRKIHVFKKGRMSWYDKI
jgi:hypothetical protein